MTEWTSDARTDHGLDGAPAGVVAAVWAEALGLDTIDPDVGFFDLGASSDTVVRVARVLRRRWPHLKIVDIFAHSTVSQLTALLDEA